MKKEDIESEINIKYSRNSGLEKMISLVSRVPFGHASREVMRMRTLEDFKSLEAPVLDVGCGDGLFWELLTDFNLTDKSSLSGLFGIDMNEHEVKLAKEALKNSGGRFEVVDITGEFKNHTLQEFKGSFKTVIANSSLEHIPDLSNTLDNIKQLMYPNGTFILFVPAHSWTNTLWLTRFLNKFSTRVGGLYEGWINGFFQHYHLYPFHLWELLLKDKGFDSISITGLGSKSGNRLYEKWLPLAFPAFIFKAIFNRYPTFALSAIKQKCLAFEKKFIQDVDEGEILHEDLMNNDIVEYCIICKNV